MAKKFGVAKASSFGRYELNPRGNLWLNDENKFGLKLMTKMGWSQGKGLGRNEDGSVEQIRVNVKNSKSGVGWNENPLITAQTEEFESLLSHLNKGHLSAKTKNVLNSIEDRGLEQRSQKFRKRLHYQKFVRGKDVSRYSDDDMKSIFILKKSLDKSITAKGDSQTAENSCKFSSKSVESNKGNLNITEYFAKKMQEKIRSIALQTKSVGNKSHEVAVPSIAEAKVDVECEDKEKKPQSGKKRKRSEEEVSNSFQAESPEGSIALKTKSIWNKSQEVAVPSIAEAKVDVECEDKEKKHQSGKKRKRSEEEVYNSFQAELPEGEGLKPSKKCKKKSRKFIGVYTSLKSCLKS